MMKRITHWNTEEELAYHFFLTVKADQLLTNPNNKPQGFYVEMGRFISTRDQKQCRSHHQKMVGRFKRKAQKGKLDCQEKNLRKFFYDHIELRLLDRRHLLKQITHHLIKKVAAGQLSKDQSLSYLEKAELNIYLFDTTPQDVKMESESKPSAEMKEERVEVEEEVEVLSDLQVISPLYRGSSSISDFICGTFSPLNFEEEVFEQSE